MVDDPEPRRPLDGEPISVLPGDLPVPPSELELVGDIWAADAREARYVAQRAASIVELAKRRHAEQDASWASPPAEVDPRAAAQAELAFVSQTFVPELALIRSCTEVEAQTLAVEALILVRRLPATWSALYEGRIDVRRMRAMVDLLGSAKADVAARIEERVLSAAGRLTVPQLRGRIRRLLARWDAEALEARYAEAKARADARYRATSDGMAELVIDLSQPTAAACVDAIDQHARALAAAGDTRPLGVIRAAVAAELILRPWVNRPAVTAQLTIHAPLAALYPPEDGVSQPPAEVDGHVVTAAQCRALLEELDLLGVGPAAAGGCVRLALGDPITGRMVAVATRTELSHGAGGTRRRRRTRAGRSRGRRLAGESAASGAGAGGPVPGSGSGEPTAEGPGLGPPSATSRYRPTAAQKRFVTTRDRTCRMPGCRRRAGRCDIDHVTAHADGGATACWNLCCLCRRHHRIKTFAPGWSFLLLADGRLAVRTPSGVTRISAPPGTFADDEPDPPWLEEQHPPDQFRC